jgi:hypothetical protein
MKRSSALDTIHSVPAALPRNIRQTVTMTALDPRMTAPTPSATLQEAAAIAAAIERFTHDTAPPAGGGGEVPDPWTRAARLAGVMREEHADVPHPWINS